MNAGVELVEVVRSGFTESVHRGSVLVVGPDGADVLALGDVDSPVFPRSSNKPMQAVGMLRSGADLAGAELAIAAASHSGEPAHVERVRALLAGVGRSEADLACPAALPLHPGAAGDLLAAGGKGAPVYMNCSGKHAGMVATCVAAGWPVEGYLDPGHPLQLTLAAAVADLTGEPVTAVGVDGCGAPLFALSLRGLARAFARLVTAAPGTFERRVADAMRAHPHLVAGTDRDDTLLMTGIGGLLTKGGAEGVHAAALPSGAAVAVKIDDGAARPRTPVLVGGLRRLGVRAGVLDELAETPVLGGGRMVGSARLVAGV
ncbi:MAG TPA: asparaginase [Mycobacteriales bacterium]|nr:asparaginase [Mycobacteriales bacterium]